MKMFSKHATLLNRSIHSPRKRIVIIVSDPDLHKMLLKISIIVALLTITRGRLLSPDGPDLDPDLAELENMVEEENEGGDPPIPLQNVREIRLKSLYRLSPQERAEAVQYYEEKIDRESTTKRTDLWSLLIPDTEVAARRALQKELLNRFVYAECGWALELPSPFSNNQTQCSLQELQYLLDNTDKGEKDH